MLDGTNIPSHRKEDEEKWGVMLSKNKAPNLNFSATLFGGNPYFNFGRYKLQFDMAFKYVKIESDEYNIHISYKWAKYVTVGIWRRDVYNAQRKINL